MELITLNELKELMEEINGSDELVGIKGNYKANGIDGLEVVELTELMELMEY